MAFLVMDTTTNKIENYTTSRDVTRARAVFPHWSTGFAARR